MNAITLVRPRRFSGTKPQHPIMVNTHKTELINNALSSLSPKNWAIIAPSIH
ncbi:uncharacterized protein VTP21DRAFT_4729 [Calcarisporiella thermophila]|uniref:uncharacterized protein n=1 Tax=Calcarisporiella thermophila TaxID=911321 RepID=UPI0037434E47